MSSTKAPGPKCCSSSNNSSNKSSHTRPRRRRYPSISRRVARSRCTKTGRIKPADPRHRVTLATMCHTRFVSLNIHRECASTCTFVLFSLQSAYSSCAFRHEPDLPPNLFTGAQLGRWPQRKSRRCTTNAPKYVAARLCKTGSAQTRRRRNRLSADERRVSLAFSRDSKCSSQGLDRACAPYHADPRVERVCRDHRKGRWIQWPYQSVVVPCGNVLCKLFCGFGCLTQNGLPQSERCKAWILQQCTGKQLYLLILRKCCVLSAKRRHSSCMTSIMSLTESVSSRLCSL